jgi:hypothetical protein
MLRIGFFWTRHPGGDCWPGQIRQPSRGPYVSDGDGRAGNRWFPDGKPADAREELPMKQTNAVVGPKTKCVSSKLTDEEYRALETAAGGQPLSTWARDTLLQVAAPGGLAAAPKRIETIVMAEVLALRAILLNLHFALATGDPITVERMQYLIERADADKRSHAIARLEETAGEDKR